MIITLDGIDPNKYFDTLLLEDGTYSSVEAYYESYQRIVKTMEDYLQSQDKEASGIEIAKTLLEEETMKTLVQS